MGNSFFITDPKRREQRQKEIAERDARNDQEQVTRAAHAVALRDAADQDLHAARVIAMSKLIRPDNWTTHDSFKEMARKERAGPRGNTEEGEKLATIFDRNADSSIVYAVELAEQAIALAQSWGRA